MEQRISNMSRVILALFISGREMKIDEIEKESGLRKRQVYMAIKRIKTMEILRLRREKKQAGYKTLPEGFMFVSLKKERRPFVQSYLDKHGVI